MDLNFIWFILITILFIGYVVLDGFDLGVGMNHLEFKSEKSRRISINSIGPVWDANEVWLITAGGALFAAFPNVYATIFSGFYTAFMLFLLVIIGRAISIEFRSKVDSIRWKKIWDAIFCISSYLITLLLGISLGNIVQGIPIEYNREFTGSFWTLLNPYAIYVGLVAILLLKFHGKLYLLNKTDTIFQEKHSNNLKKLWLFSFGSTLLLHLWTIIQYSNNLINYYENGGFFLIPILALLFLIISRILIISKKYYYAFLTSSFSLAFLILESAIMIFPNLVPSTINPDFSLSIYNSSSSELTLYTMFIIACIGIPLLLLYKVIIYSAFKGKVEIDSTSY